MKQLLLFVAVTCCISFAMAAEPDSVPTTLTLKQAQEYALAHHPEIQAADFKARADEQRIREARSGFFPQVTANVSAVGADDNDNTRIGATGGLNNPTVLSRESNGVLISQMITDFGRTAELTSSSRYQAYSSEQMAQAARARVLMNVTRAYYTALGAKSVLEVAKQTVDARQLLVDRVKALAKGNLKSSLDVSFAEVSLDEANLLQLRAENRVDESFATLSAALGSRGRQALVLGEQPMPSAPRDTVDPLIEQALNQRPELIAAKAERDAALKFAAAEQSAQYPTVTALGAAGVSPLYDDKKMNETYAAGGVNVAFPVFNGGKLSAKAEEARLRAEASQKLLDDQENQVVRDVQVAWLNSKAAFKGIQVSQNLLNSATHAMELAQSRYNLGISSIVELNQAQLQVMEAEIAHTTAGYEYQTRRAELDYQLGSLK